MNHSKISDELYADARRAAAWAGRSIAEQFEFWVRSGQTIELLLGDARVVAAGRPAVTEPVSQLLTSVDTPAGHKRVAEHLRSGPFPHYSPAPGRPGLLLREDLDGTCSAGRFIGREFRPFTQYP